MRVSWLLFAGALLGCSDATNAPAEFMVATTTNPPVAHVGERVDVTLTITNTSNVAQTVDYPATGCPRSFVVVDGTGTIVGPGPDGPCDAAARIVTLAPGESFALTEQWFGDASAGDPSAVGGHVAVGSYTIRDNLGLDNAHEQSALVRLIP